ncbi:DDE_Tnp_1_7 domain-containing protein [Trichonephila clavipes]|nr:DDE_Tnp_1_7 domain-containing protein [Trichonephila clavipes]
MPLYDTMLLEHNVIALTVYQRKTSKNVTLFRSLHPTVDIDNNHPKILPETISFYNSTKFGIDIVDQIAQKYFVNAGSKRWPGPVFYNVLDLAGIKSWILYKIVTRKKLTRREYLQQVIEELRAY